MKRLNLVILVSVLLLSCISIFPLFHSGFFPMHDNTQVQRVYEMGKSLGDGMIPVRWVSDLGYGYGYPIFTFYAPLAYYVGGFISLVSTSLFATKVMIGMGMLLSGIFMYVFASKLFGKLAGAVAGVFYIFAPYHAVDLYVRGDVAELWAYAFIPLAFYGFWKIKEETHGKNVLIAAIGFAGIILSHNLTALMVTPFLVVFAILFSLFSTNKPYAISHTLYAIILGLGLSAFYFLPVFAEMKYTNVLSQVGGGANFHDHFVCLSQLWQSQWGYGGSAKGCIDGLSFMIGKIHILFSLIGFISVPFVWKKNKKVGGVILFCTGALIFVCYLMLDQSVFVWDFFKPMAFLQYPWRFLLLASFFTSLLSGAVLFGIQKYVTKQIYVGITVIVIIGVLFFNAKYFTPQTYTNFPSSWYLSSNVLFDVSKISDEYMPAGFEKPKVPPRSLLMGNINGSTILNKTQEKKVQVSLRKDQAIGINLAYFPAWIAIVDGVKTPLLETKTGTQIHVTAGVHNIDIQYRQTPVERLGNILSLTSVLILILVIIKGQVGNKYGSKSS